MYNNIISIHCYTYLREGKENFMKTSYKEIKHNKRISIITIIISSIILIILLIVFFITKINDDNKNVLESYKIEVDTDTKPLKIPLKDLPLIYNSLIDGIDLNNEQDFSTVKYQLNRISPKIIYKNSSLYYILLNYNCGEKLCDYVLIKYSNKKVKEYIYLTFGTYSSSKISNNGDSLAIDFNRQEGSNVCDNLMLIDLKKLNLKQNSKIPQEYTYNIIFYDWSENVLNIKYKKDSMEGKLIIK